MDFEAAKTAKKPGFFKQLFFDVRKKTYNLSTYLGYKYNLKIYNKSFFEENRQAGITMAEWFMPILRETFNFKSLIDVGCGAGHYLKYCLDHGMADVYGIEGAEDAFSLLLVDKKYVLKHDLRKPLTLSRKWDVCLSIEVAEHVDRLYSDNYVKILTDASDTIILTAAHPKQGGTAHVNEQPREWWINKFKKFGYEYDKQTTDKIKADFRKAAQQGHYVADCFHVNILIFKKGK